VRVAGEPWDGCSRFGGCWHVGKGCSGRNVLMCSEFITGDGCCSQFAAAIIIS